jgi:hypothetical protein
MVIVPRSGTIPDDLQLACPRPTAHRGSREGGAGCRRAIRLSH